MMGNYEKTRVQVEELLPLCQEIKYTRVIGGAYMGFGMVAFGSMEYNQAHDFFQKCVDIWRELDQRDERAAGIGCIGGANIKSGDLLLARQNLSDALRVVVELRVIWAASWTLPC